ncbi:TPA: restriction endonuclease [Aeromonas veronii]
MKEHSKFEDLVVQIFKSVGFNVEDINKVFKTKSGNQHELDFSLHEHEKKYAVEVKYYRENTPINLYQRAIILLQSKIKIFGFNSGILVTSGVMPEILTQEIKDSEIIVIDQFDLIELAADSVILSEKLASFLSDRRAISEGRFNRTNKAEIISKIRIKNATTTNKPSFILKKKPPVKNYCKDLKAIKPGHAEYVQHERKCVEILKYIFNHELTGWSTQQSSSNGLNRFDLVARVKAESGFWSFLSKELGSRYIIFEFKNHTDEIEQGEVLTTEKYLYKTSLRTVAFIISRKGASQNAIRFIEGAMREHGKLIMVLEDNDLCKMLEMKEQADEPSEYLFEKVDAFLMSLPR